MTARFFSLSLLLAALYAPAANAVLVCRGQHELSILENAANPLRAYVTGWDNVTVEVSDLEPAQAIGISSPWKIGASPTVSVSKMIFLESPLFNRFSATGQIRGSEVLRFKDQVVPQIVLGGSVEIILNSIKPNPMSPLRGHLYLSADINGKISGRISAPGELDFLLQCTREN